jgi:hypothetical protein
MGCSLAIRRSWHSAAETWGFATFTKIAVISGTVARLAQRGERDLVRLRAAAILEVLPDKRPKRKSAARTSAGSVSQVEEQ